MVDYMVVEAVVVRTRMEDRENEEEAKKKNWKKDHSSLEAYR